MFINSNVLGTINPFADVIRPFEMEMRSTIKSWMPWVACEKCSIVLEEFLTDIYLPGP